jgi:hypothetical protein
MFIEGFRSCGGQDLIHRELSVRLKNFVFLAILLLPTAVAGIE